MFHMKNIYRLFTCIFLMLLTGSVSASVSTDTTKPIPFYENWNSGLFSTNNWSFPYMQGNWTITTRSGDTSLNAEFTGQPFQTNYINELRSEWLDATQLTCDYINLDFDMRSQATNLTGTEHLRVVIEMDTVADTLSTFSNNISNQGWKHHSLGLYMASARLFRIKFIAYGPNSANLIAWSLDNIAVTRKCKPPRALVIQNTGQCGFSSCQVRLSWTAPVCSGNSGIISFVYDDGTAENGMALMPGYLGWFGNKFPLSPDQHGCLSSFDLWFWYNPARGNDMLTIDVFDMNLTLLGSSAPFQVPDSNWVTVNVNDIWFQGPFYAMVKWDHVSALTNWLGLDSDGPYQGMNLSMYYDGTYMITVGSMNCGDAGNFMERAHATLDYKKKKSPLDTTLMLGYNIYKTENIGNTDYVKINNSPVTDTIYTDTIDCAASYYVTTQYNNCESDPTFIQTASCSLVIPEKSTPVMIKIDPNPASGFTEISSDFLINIIMITDHYGRQVKEVDNAGQNKIRLDLSDLKNGMYILSTQTAGGDAVQKIIIQH
jgi:hypothetical protein